MYGLDLGKLVKLILFSVLPDSWFSLFGNRLTTMHISVAIKSGFLIITHIQNLKH